MGTIILMLWAVYMLYGYLKNFKIIYAKDRKNKLAEMVEKMKKQRDTEDMFVPAGYIVIVLLVLIYSIFWLVMATTFTNIILTSYCIFVVLYIFIGAGKTLTILNSKDVEVKDSFLQKILLPVNTVVVISFIIVLAERVVIK